MSTTIKAIETRYAGCHFRSRLEARWAVFFDALGVPWEYEPQGYEGCHGQRYLPDFLIPAGGLDDDDLYVEVKGTDEQLAKDGERIGQCIDYQSTPISDGLLILGPVPHVPPETAYVTHSFCYWRKGVEHTQAWIRPTIGGCGYSLYPARHHAAAAWLDNTSEELPESATVEALVWPPVTFSKGGKPHTFRERVDPKLLAAYTAARSARFEHGQSGANSTITGRAVLGNAARRPHPAVNAT